MEQVRAKMKCVKNETAQGGEILLTPVISGSDENKRFYAATPGGSVHLSILNQPASDYFKEGREYYVDFCAADALTDAEKAKRYDAEHGGPYEDNSPEAIAERARLERERQGGQEVGFPHPNLVAPGEGQWPAAGKEDGRTRPADNPANPLRNLPAEPERDRAFDHHVSRSPTPAEEAERLNSASVDGKVKKK